VQAGNLAFAGYLEIHLSACLSAYLEYFVQTHLSDQSGEKTRTNHFGELVPFWLWLALMRMRHNTGSHMSPAW